MSVICTEGWTKFRRRRSSWAAVPHGAIIIAHSYSRILSIDPDNASGSDKGHYHCYRLPTC